jgi:cell division protein FtsB
MQNSTQDEFEEVESPFNRPKTRPSKLRSKKSHFNRTFAADPSIAPAVFESSDRKSIGFQDQSEFADFRESKISESKVDYLDGIEDEQLEEEVEEEEVRPVKRPSSLVRKKVSKKPVSKLVKFTWLIIGILTLRLFFMDRGVMDYFVAESNLENLQGELKNLQNENKDLELEINRIKFDKGYQKQLAKEHLGVIAVDEFLILFAGESLDNTTDSGDSKSSI